MSNSSAKDNYNQVTKCVRYQIVPASKIRSDAGYQRKLDTRKVNNIVKEFDSLKVNHPKVSERDGWFYVFDGQHTVEALKRIGANSIACLVYRNLGFADEAELFATQDDNKTKVQAGPKLKSRYNAGKEGILKEAKVVDMVDRTRAHGIIVDFSSSPGKGKCVAYGALETVYDNCVDSGDLSNFDSVLDLIWQAWQGEKKSLSATILKAVSAFQLAYSGEYEHDRVLTALKSLEPKALIAAGNRHPDMSGDDAIALEIALLYNGIKKRKNQLSTDKLSVRRK